MEITKLDLDFTVCKVEDFSHINLDDDFVFIGKTDEEKSVVCNSLTVPENVIECENDWKGFRIDGILDFSLVGILAKISSILANDGISIYAISTFNTDYILVKKDNFERALLLLSQNGYDVN